ncbi:MAG TPA: TetR/AcrR family transcriptional regulator [Terriglobales bacterium]|nr:TetR/AcrR family transcriptional regulator [Terriglobales bacterium]
MTKLKDSESGGTRVVANSGRRERRRLETREKIFRAALRLFSERGLSGTTIEDITEAADVGKGTFFNYFQNKEQVLSVLAEGQLAKIHAAVVAARDEKRPVKETARQMMTALAQEPSRSDTLARSLLMALLSNEAAREMLVPVLGHGREVLAGLFAAAQDRGEIGRAYKPKELACLFQQTFFGAVLMWALRPDEPLATHLEPAFELMWTGAAVPMVRRSRKRQESGR